MKYFIRFKFNRAGEVAYGSMAVWAEDVRYALRLVEMDLDVLGASVLSVVPLEERALLSSSLEQLRSLTKGESCDHSVGICYCDAFNLMDRIAKSLEE